MTRRSSDESIKEDERVQGTNAREMYTYITSRTSRTSCTITTTDACMMIIRDGHT